MQRALWKYKAARTLQRIAIVATAGCGVATVAGFLGSWWWMFDLLAHFRPHYVVILLVTTFGLGISWRFRIAATAGALLFVNVAVVAPLYVSSPAPPAVGAIPLRVVSFNVNFRSGEFRAAATYLATADADVVFLLEATPPAVAAAKVALPGYKLIDHSDPGPWGIAAFTRVAVRSARMHRHGPGPYPALAVVVDHHGVSYKLLAIHPPPPISSQFSRDRDTMLAEVGDWANTKSGNVVIIGDFNATPWSAPMRSLVSATGFKNSQRGFGIQATWPNGAGPLSIPIDHCLHSPGLTTVRRSVGGYHGSDHRPLSVDLAPRRPQ